MARDMRIKNLGPMTVTKAEFMDWVLTHYGKDCADRCDRMVDASFIDNPTAILDQLLSEPPPVLLGANVGENQHNGPLHHAPLRGSHFSGQRFNSKV
jgi:hypothetical protein